MTRSSPSPQRLQVPWVTLGFVTLNLLAAFGSALFPDATERLAFDPGSPTLLAAFASLFLHANLLHLLGNMVFLAAVGPRVEAVAGRIQYIVIYLAAGLLGVVSHWWISRATGSSNHLLGASGAIAGCVGYCSIRFLGKRVPLAPGTTVSVGAVALIWVGLQAAGAFVRFGQMSGGGVAFWAHLAGFLGGLVIGLAFQAPRQASLQFGHDLIDRMSTRGPAAVVETATRHLQEHPGDRRALRELANALHTMGDKHREAETLVQLVDDATPEELPGILQTLSQCEGLRLLQPLVRLKLAEQIREGSAEVSRQLIRSVVGEEGAEAYRPDALLALAIVEDDENRGPILEELTSTYELHPATQIARQKGLIR